MAHLIPKSLAKFLSRSRNRRRTPSYILFDTLPDPAVYCRSDGSLERVNRSFTRFFGVDNNIKASFNLNELLQFNSDTCFHKLVSTNYSLSSASEDVLLNPNGSRLDVQVTVHRVEKGDLFLLYFRNISHFRQIERDLRQMHADLERLVQQRTADLEEVNALLREEIANREQIERQLRHDSFHDTMTGLPNRSFLEAQIKLAIHRYKRSGKPFALLFIDIDKLKIINDTLGHTAGDTALLETARRLSGCIRSADLLTRWGGDQFALLLTEIEDVVEATHTAVRIHNSLGKNIIINKSRVFISVCIGITVMTDQYSCPDRLLQDADTALNRAKEEGRSQYAVFDEKMYQQALSYMETEQRLRHGLENMQFSLQYQPIITLESETLAGFEALIRWNRDGKVYPPGSFIPLAEDTDLIIPIGRWVLGKACETMARWRRELYQAQDLHVCVNISSRQLKAPGLVQDVKEALQRNNLPASCLVLEITESSVIEDLDKAVKVLTQISDMGVRLSMDDFGEGYTSLQLLHRLPIHTMKIDKSFITGLGAGTTSSGLAHTLVRLGHSLEKEVVAEGIEAEEDLVQLKEFKCEFGQGFHFSHPMSEDQIPEFIAKGAALSN